MTKRTQVDRLDIPTEMEQIIRTVDDIKRTSDSYAIGYRLGQIRKIAKMVQNKTDLGGWS